MSLDQTGFFQRVCEALETENVQQIADRTKVKKQSVYLWQKGGWPSLETLGLIADSSNTSLHWLLTGKGEKYLTRNEQRRPKQLALNASPDDTAPAPLIPEMGYPTAQHKIVDFPLRGAISGQTIEHEVSRVLVPSNLVSANSILFKIKGDNLAAEGLHEGDVLIARPANGDADGKIVIATLDGKTIVRHLSVTKKLALLSPIEGNRPVIKSALADLTINFVVTSIARSFE